MSDGAVDKVRDLLNLFRLERYAYLGVSGISAVFLFACAITLMLRPDDHMKEVFGMFTSGGVLTVVTTRFLRMWNDAIGVVFTAPTPVAKEAQRL